MFCSKCGAALAADAAFCQSCGATALQPAIGGSYSTAISPHAGVGAIAYATNVTYAGFWLRFVAYLLDQVILGIATMVLTVPLFFLMGGAAMVESLIREGNGGVEPGQIAGILALVFGLSGVIVIVNWLYYAYLESGEKQATWGKQVLGIYVTDLSGNRITFGRASGRFFAKLITGLIPFAIGFIMAGFTERKQALHDMIASCLVLRR